MISIKRGGDANVSKIESKYNSVLKRRNSRLSIDGPCVIDVDYAGASSAHDHLCRQRNDRCWPDTHQLNFEFNLRNYNDPANRFRGT